MISEIIRTAYPHLKKVEKGNFKTVKGELDLLGIVYSDDDLVKAFTIVSQSNSIDEALNAIDSIDSLSITKVKTKIKTEQKTEKIKQDKIKQEEKKKRLQQKNERLQQKKESEGIKLAKKKADSLNPFKSIDDYKVVGGKDYGELQEMVKIYMKSGWVPYGGITAYNPGGKIGLTPNSFFQAMVKFK